MTLMASFILASRAGLVATRFLDKKAEIVLLVVDFEVGGVVEEDATPVCPEE